MRLLHSGLTLSFALALAGCGDGLTQSGTPSSPTGGGATPTPAATPTPSPTPTATPSVKSCSLAPQRNCAADTGPSEFGCCTERNIGSPEAGFSSAIDDAQGFVAANRPEFFDSGRVKSGSERSYTAAVVKRLTEETGICSAAPSYIPEDEIALKSTQAQSQIFDIIQGNGTPTQRYATLCRPAVF